MSSSIHIVFDEAALEALFKEQFKSLCAYCQSRFGFEIDEAKEVVHTSFPTGMKDYMIIFPVPLSQVQVMNNPSLFPQNPGYN
jgi:hypothetical protein